MALFLQKKDLKYNNIHLIYLVIYLLLLCFLSSSRATRRGDTHQFYIKQHDYLPNYFSNILYHVAYFY